MEVSGATCSTLSLGRIYQSDYWSTEERRRCLAAREKCHRLW